MTVSPIVTSAPAINSVNTGAAAACSRPRMNREGGIVGVDLDGLGYVRIIRGPVNGVQEHLGLLACLLKHRRRRGQVQSGLARRRY